MHSLHTPCIMVGGGSRVLSFAPHYCSSFKAIVDTNDHDITSTRPRSDRVPLNGGGYGILPDKGGTKDGNTGTTNAATGNKYGGGNSKAARKRAAKATREAQAKQSSPMVDPTTTGEAGYARDLQSVTYGNYTAREVCSILRLLFLGAMSNSFSHRWMTRLTSAFPSSSSSSSSFGHLLP